MKDNILPQINIESIDTDCIQICKEDKELWKRTVAIYLKNGEVTYVTDKKSSVYAADKDIVKVTGDITVFAKSDATVYAKGNAIVHANGNAIIYAEDNVKVYADDKVKVYAEGNVNVYANDNVFVVANNNAIVHAQRAASVYAEDNTSVYCGDHSNIDASDNAIVYARGYAVIKAKNHAIVNAWEFVNVHAQGNVVVNANGNAVIQVADNVTVNAGKHNIINFDADNYVGKINGGIQVEIPKIKTAEEWCEYWGVEVKDGVAILYKGTDDDYSTFCARSADIYYRPGETPRAPDWDNGKKECGGGLHFSPTPFHVFEFRCDVSHFIACPVRVDEIVVHYPAGYPEKVKAPRVYKPCYEVDINGNLI